MLYIFNARYTRSEELMERECEKILMNGIHIVTNLAASFIPGFVLQSTLRSYDAVTVFLNQLFALQLLIVYCKQQPLTLHHAHHTTDAYFVQDALFV